MLTAQTVSAATTYKPMMHDKILSEWDPSLCMLLKTNQRPSLYHYHTPPHRDMHSAPWIKVHSKIAAADVEAEAVLYFVRWWHIERCTLLRAAPTPLKLGCYVGLCGVRPLGVVLIFELGVVLLEVGADLRVPVYLSCNMAHDTPSEWLQRQSCKHTTHGKAQCFHLHCRDLVNSHIPSGFMLITMI